MTNYKFKIAYDGTRYYGWERQPGKDTIQGKLESVLSRFDGNPVEVIGAGRTDAGVHAKGMVANARLNFSSDPDELRDYMNRYLPDDIAVVDVGEASERFHARFLAKSKIYCYTVFNGDVRPVFNRRYYTFVEEPLYEEPMVEAASYLEGEHDFKAFCANPRMKKSTVRNLFRAEVRRSKGYYYFTYEGSGFLQYQVRIMTGTLLEIGMLKRQPEEILSILESKERSVAGFTAPPKGLTLLKVKYS